MGWIKRNLIFVIGCAVALALLGAGGYYIFSGWSANSQTSEKLNEIYGTLKNLQSQTPAPGNEKVNNTDIAKQQQQDVQGWINSAIKYFQPIPVVPAGEVTSEAFASALRRTADLLQKEADSAGVVLPPKYDFSFAAERPLVRFATGSLVPLATQLGEVKTILETVFSARVNALDGIQRARVSEDDINGPQTDYTDKQSITNDLAVVTPYIISFRCFTPELARVISAFASSTNAMVIKSINVQPAGMVGSPDATMGAPGAYPPGAVPGGGYPLRIPGEYTPPVAQPPGMFQVQPGKGGLQTVLKEQLLKVTMEVDLVKLLPKS